MTFNTVIRQHYDLITLLTKRQAFNVRSLRVMMSSKVNCLLPFFSYFNKLSHFYLSERIRLDRTLPILCMRDDVQSLVRTVALLALWPWHSKVDKSGNRVMLLMTIADLMTLTGAQLNWISEIKSGVQRVWAALAHELHPGLTYCKAVIKWNLLLMLCVNEFVTRVSIFKCWILYLIK